MIIKGELEIDQKRGVIYFHADEKELLKSAPTVLRICQLPKPIPNPVEHGCLDITHMVGCDWGKS